MICKLGKHDLNNLQLNSRHAKSKFIMKIEENHQQLTFPNLREYVFKKEDSRLRQTIYRKKSYPNCYLNTQSQHNPVQFQKAMKTRVKRSQKVADTSRHYFKRIFRQHRASTQISKPKTEKEELKLIMKGITDKIEKALKHQIATTFTALSEDQKHFTQHKDENQPENSRSLRNCSRDCQQTYLHQINSSVRKNGHQRAIRKEERA